MLQDRGASVVRRLRVGGISQSPLRTIAVPSFETGLVGKSRCDVRGPGRQALSLSRPTTILLVELFLMGTGWKPVRQVRQDA